LPNQFHSKRQIKIGAFASVISAAAADPFGKVSHS